MSDVLGPLQRQWVEALKSGKYKQCTEELKYVTYEGSSYCCLGVAKEVFDLPETDTVTLLDTYTDLCLKSSSGEFEAPIRCYGHIYNSLAHMNDGSDDHELNLPRLSFKDIALVIENYWYLIFTDKV